MTEYKSEQEWIDAGRPLGRWLTDEEMIEWKADNPMFPNATRVWREEIVPTSTHFVAGSEVTLYGIDRDGNRIEPP